MTAAQAVESFPSSVNTWQLTNTDYNTNDVKIRLDGTTDVTVSFSVGKTLSFTIVRDGNAAILRYRKDGKDYTVQQIDLNDGKPADDFRTPNQKDNKTNTMVYHGSNIAGVDEYAAITFDNNTYLTSFDDKDGVSGGPAAYFRQKVSGNVLMCTLSQQR